MVLLGSLDPRYTDGDSGVPLTGPLNDVYGKRAKSRYLKRRASTRAGKNEELSLFKYLVSQHSLAFIDLEPKRILRFFSRIFDL